jgi:hypothetical protein
MTQRAEDTMIAAPRIDSKDGTTPKIMRSSTTAKIIWIYTPVEPRVTVSRCNPNVKRVWKGNELLVDK